MLHQTRHMLSACLLVLAGVSFAACNSPMEVQEGPGELLGSQGAVVDAGQPVFALSDFSQVGTSTLVRTRNGVNYRLSTSELEPGSAYTLWILVFNDPEGCATPLNCVDADIVNPDAKPDMLYAAGTLVGRRGTATFAGRLKVGDLSGSINDPVSLPAFGLMDPFGAEIWLAVHQHGPKIPEFMPDMIQSVDGGCTDAGIPEAGVSSPWNDHPGFGRRGPNTCQTIQIAFHQP